MLSLITFFVASLVIGLLITTVITPEAAKRLVKLEEQQRLYQIAARIDVDDAKVAKRDFSALQAPNIRLVNKEEVPAEGTILPLGQTGLTLVSYRPLNIWEAAKVVRPEPGRRIVPTLLTVIILYFLASLLARFVNKPITQLLEGVRDLAEGKEGVSVPIPSESELAELATSFNDMAESLAARESELKQALAAKDRIFATASHELRTPLTVILGYCQLLEDGMKGELSEEQRQSLSVIHRNADGLLQQVEALLTISQLRAGSLPFERELIDLRELASELRENFAPLAESRGLELLAEMGPDPVLVSLDYKRGLQIGRNLLSNALKFTTEGTINLRVAVQAQNATFEVSDTGPGISPDFEEKLFTEFNRGPETEGIEGSGLGLALSRRLARSMDGEVRLQSTGPKGSTFVWTQPV